MLHVHHSPDAEDLVAALAQVLREPLPDVLGIEQVAVHSRGLERWLAQRLSHALGVSDAGDDGICAGIEFPFPGRLVHRALAQAASPGVEPGEDPWLAARLRWHLLELLEERPETADGTPLAAHLERDDDAGPVRRFGAVHRVAELFDRYAVHRPRLLRRWLEDAAAVDARGEPLPATHAWQAGMWRSLHDHVLARTGVPSPPARLDTAMEALVRDPDVTDLPARVSIFGLTALPASHLSVCTALAAHRDVHLFLLHPSPALWRTALPLLRGVDAELPTRELDPLADVPANPLLRTWGRDAREMQVVLASASVRLDPEPVPTRRSTPRVPTLLQRVQANVLDDRSPPGVGAAADRPLLDPDDRSIEVHSCHGPSRQVEVLRDVLLRILAADDTLEPRDVLVLCPDLDTFTPLLEGTFRADAPVGASAAAESPDDGDRLRPAQLRVRVADRTLARTSQLLRVGADLLRLADGRVTSSEVLDLCARPPVRAAFGLDDDRLERASGWVVASGARWGLDLDHRRRWGVPTDAGTWRAALDRLLVGAAVADDGRTVGHVVPFDDVVTSDLELLGDLAELLDRLTRTLDALREPRAIDGWCQALREGVRLLTDGPEVDGRDRVRFEHLLGGLLDAATTDDTASSVELCLAEFRGLLQEQLAATTTSARHRTGDLTVASFVPMRSVPHRVIALLGMDDGAVPRRGRTDGDDLLALDPTVGDRDPRTEDRQLLLDALLAARERLVVLTSGHDERTNEPRPPALPVGELLDVVDRTVRPAPDAGVDRASGTLVVHHRLHAFDPANFTDGAFAGLQGPLGSDPAELAGARALIGDRGPLAPPFVAEPLAPVDEPVLELDDLVRTVVDPVGSFCSERLGLRDRRDDPLRTDELPLELEGLPRWRVGDRVLRAMLDDRDPGQALRLEPARGDLPPGELGTPAVASLRQELDEFDAVLVEHGIVGAARPPVDVDVALGGRRLLGAVDGVVGDTIRAVRFSRLSESHRLRAWVLVVTLSAASPQAPWRAVTVGRAQGGGVATSVLGPLGTDPEQRADLALEQLRWFAQLRDRAMVEPLPLATRSSGRFATTLLDLRSPKPRFRNRTSQAASEWDQAQWGEARQQAHRLVRGGIVGFHALLDEAPLEDETSPPWDLQETTRFGRWALRLWEPLLAAEKLR